MNTPDESTPPKEVFFYQGLERYTDTPESSFKKKVKELCNVKHLNFLFGAGTSAGAVPAMNEMKKSLDASLKGGTKELCEIYETVKKDNLEDVLNVLYARRFHEDGIGQDSESTQKLIDYIQAFMYQEINVSFEPEKSVKNLELYKTFYSKLSLRNRDLSRINVFTTNNDLFNERALDNLNINYNNGFGGGLERFFNPARFRYTHSKRVDLNLEKFEPIDNMVYLYKLHGSINWVESTSNSLFDIHEIPIKTGEGASDQPPALIFPTPLKQNQSLGAPYADLIREFQAKLTLQNSVLFVVGYSFSDEHLNNIIYQALASNTSLSVVVFGDHEKCLLGRIGDSRVYRFHGEVEDVNGDNKNVHFFEYIVNNLLPNVDDNRDKTLLEDFIKQLEKVTSED